RADALTVWIAARERARDALLAEAAGLCRQGLASEAVRCRSAARLLAIRALKELAAVERINPSYLTRVLRLMLLAPGIVEAVLARSGADHARAAGGAGSRFRAP